MDGFSLFSKFASELVRYAMDLYNFDWMPPEPGLGHPLVSFTREHADILIKMLEIEEHYPILFEFCSFSEEMDEFKFVETVRDIEHAFLQDTCLNVSSLLFFAALVSRLAIFSTLLGFPDAPEYAVNAISCAVSSFHLEDSLLQSMDISNDSSSRTIL